MNNQTLTRKELYDLVWSTPFTTLAKKYLISDNGLRKICLKMDIPLPKSGHWGKIQFNKPVEIIKLSPDYSGEKEIALALRQEGDESKGSPSQIIALEKEIKSKEEQSLVVPDRLTNPDKLIIAARESLIKKNARTSYRGGFVGTSINEPNISVTPENVSRALRFMDTFIKVIKKRGHSITFRNHTTYVTIQGEAIEIYFREKLKRVPKVSNYGWQEYDYFASGILCFNAKISWHITEWKDGSLTLEKQLAKIIAKLEIKGEELKQQSIESEIYRAEQEVKQRIEKERQKRKDKEFEDFKLLMKNAKQWQEAVLLRNYLNELEAKAKNDNKITEELENWLLWARKKTDWYDPQINAKDELLNDTDKENLNITKKPNPYYYG